MTIFKRLLKHRRLDFFAVDCIKVVFNCICKNVSFLDDETFFYVDINENRESKAGVRADVATFLSWVVFLIVLWWGFSSKYGIYAGIAGAAVHMILIKNIKTFILKVVEFSDEYEKFNHQEGGEDNLKEN